MIYPMDLQEMPLWCWAAVACSVERYFDPATSLNQCTIASDTWGISCCPRNPACNRASSLPDVLSRYGRLIERRASPVEFRVIQRQIRRNRPLCVRVEWLGGSGHYLVISGFRVSAGVPYVELSDPLYDWSRIPLETFTNRYRGIGMWTHTYFV